MYVYHMRNPFLNVVAFSFSAISHMSTYAIYMYMYVYIYKSTNYKRRKRKDHSIEICRLPTSLSGVGVGVATTIPVMLFVAYKNINKYKLHKSNLYFCH